MTATELVVARTKASLRVGPEFARGGEGAVHALSDAKEQVLKLYLKPPSAERLAKLQAMAGGATEALTKVAAWPTDLVVDKQGRPRGFIMPRVSASSEAHELYSPKSRAQAFPEADFRFILHVAANIVRAFGAVHQAGHVIGDVNHGHLLVGHDGRVTLIDCDSFQIQANGQLYFCDVGVPLFTPPELQGQAFRGLHRTANHDRFGLAVLLFQLLFMGRHPYAGVPLDASQSSEIEGAIKAGRFAYGANRRAHGVEQPPATLPLSTYGPGVAALFERAFAHGLNVQRPDEVEWLEQLKALQSTIRACPLNASHHFPGHLSTCTWCAIEARTGGRLFGMRLKPSGQSEPIDLNKLWGAIGAIPAPAYPEQTPTAKLKLPKRSSDDQKRLARRNLQRFAAIAGALAILLILAVVHQILIGLAGAAAVGGAAWPHVRCARRVKAKAAEAEARKAFDAVKEMWKHAASGGDFSPLWKRCAQARDELEKMPSERAQRLAALNSEAKQRELFLDSFHIAKEKISGVGPSRIATLRSFGVETALDVTSYRIQQIPGFGPATAAKLMVWRQEKEGRFRFNPNHPATLAEVRAVENDIRIRSENLFGVLRAGPVLLSQAAAESARRLEQTTPLARERWLEWKLAERRRRDL